MAQKEPFLPDGRGVVKPQGDGTLKEVVLPEDERLREQNAISHDEDCGGSAIRRRR